MALGGTDAAGLTERVVEAIEVASVPLLATVISNDAVRLRARHPSTELATLEYIEPTTKLPRVLSKCTAVIGAAGSSLWESACLGVPTAALCVARNQRTAYKQLVEDGQIVGLGDITDPTSGSLEFNEGIASFLWNATLRGELAKRAYALVDGKGKERVCDALASMAENVKSGRLEN